VVVASVAQGSSAVADWVDARPNAQRLAALLPELRRAGLTVDAVVWHQGETEAWSSHADGSAYRRALQQWINSVRALGITAPIFICLTSRDGAGTINATIRQAQASVWDARRHVYAGVDTDSLGDKFRSDGVHFNGRGLDQFARLLNGALQRRSATDPVRFDGP
jgi:lysophospholipase L1-like esterase